METVALLKTNKDHVIGVYADAAVAQAQADRYNADPFFADRPDTDAPYSVDVWSVQP